MYGLVCHQITLVTKCLLTHITGKWLLFIMYLLVSCDYSADKMPYHKHERKMAAVHYISAYVSCDYSADKCLITNIKGKWLLSTIYAPMHQMTL
jgi:hypothetical protein